MNGQVELLIRVPVDAWRAQVVGSPDGRRIVGQAAMGGRHDSTALLGPRLVRGAGDIWAIANGGSVVAKDEDESMKLGSPFAHSPDWLTLVEKGVRTCPWAISPDGSTVCCCELSQEYQGGKLRVWRKGGEVEVPEWTAQKIISPYPLWRTLLPDGRVLSTRYREDERLVLVRWMPGEEGTEEEIAVEFLGSSSPVQLLYMTVAPSGAFVVAHVNGWGPYGTVIVPLDKDKDKDTVTLGEKNFSSIIWPHLSPDGAMIVSSCGQEIEVCYLDPDHSVGDSLEVKIRCPPGLQFHGQAIGEDGYFYGVAAPPGSSEQYPPKGNRWFARIKLPN